MQTREKILALLKNHYPKEFISGEKLCQNLGLSRTAIWKHVQQLRRKGYIIEASPHLGYRLVKLPDLLLSEEVKFGLNTKFIGREVFHFDEIGSTIDIARQLAISKAKEGTLVLAEKQLKGRGRLGRKWTSPEGGIWTSIILRPSIDSLEAPKITLGTTVAVVRAIRKVTGIEATIKWPNDVLIGERKVAGILTEMSAEVGKVEFMILSVGINVNNDLKEFPQEIRAGAISLKEVKGKTISRLELFKCFLEDLEKIYTAFDKGEFDDILKEWKGLCETLGRTVRVSTINQTVQGVAEDIDEYGFLRLRISSGKIKSLSSGDATILKNS